MTHISLRTNPEEADDILAGRKSVIFRDGRIPYKEGDELKFNVVKAGRSVRHQIDTRRYEIVYVARWDNAPIEDGYVALNFREIC